MRPTRPDTLKRLRERTAARKAAGLTPDAYPVPETQRPAKPARVAPPCAHLGPELSGVERGRVGKGGSAKRWRWCDLPELPLGRVVCGCSGCSPTCTGYAPSVAAGGGGGG